MNALYVPCPYTFTHVPDLIKSLYSSYRYCVYHGLQVFTELGDNVARDGVLLIRVVSSRTL